MPLTTKSAAALVGAAAAPSKRWVRVLRTFVGCRAVVGDVIEIDGRGANELISANKVTPVAPPAPPAEPAEPAEPAAAAPTEPVQESPAAEPPTATTRRARVPKES